MIEKRKHIVARMQIRPECAAREMWFEDGMAVWVNDVDMDRAIRASGITDHAVFVPGATATLEKVEGRWLLARLELP